ncbi:MAG: hypothetical protein A2138_05345 [Deltaproteobacteria bacterium RBG_16_71_12]|nr:MAG: hypothetical protein A2138_05345 [Deltaproteobacteria bacterium RBG_16_71_12]
MLFTELPIASDLVEELAAKGFTEATPVQAAVLAELEGDLLVSSQTGSGKTLAFGLAVAPLLDSKADRGKKPRVLVMSPTRELAQQVARELQWLYRKTGAKVATCVGGMDIRREQRSLDAGAAVVVGTPGRVIDHLDRGSLVVSELEAVVLDEADEMLDMGFREEIEKILQGAPSERRTLLFSATLPREILALAKKYTRNAKRLAVGAQAAHQDITYLGHLVAPREREHAVVNVLRAHDVGTALVFCATRDGVAHLHGGLVERGFRAVALSGELSQAERNRALHEVREGRARVLVCTDVAARGIDLPAAALVVHADLPHNAEVLQHRSGRTGRAGRKGTAVILAPFPARASAERMIRAANVEGDWSPVPTVDDIRAADAVRLQRDIGALVGEGEPEDLEVAKALLEKFPAEQLAAALVRSQRRSLPAAEELPLTTSYKAAAFDRRRPRDERTAALDRRRPRADVAGPDGGVWFRINVGRNKNADPKWLVPMLCRRGHIQKRDLGRIDISRNDTMFEINPSKADAFEKGVREPDRKDPHIRIERADRERR